MQERGDRAERARKLSPQPGGMIIASPARRVHSSGRSSPCSAGWMFSCHQVAFAPPIFVCDGIGALLIHGLDHGTGSLPRGGYRNSTAFSDSGAYTLCRSEAVKPGLSLVALPTHNGCRQASGSLRKASQHIHNVRAQTGLKFAYSRAQKRAQLRNDTAIIAPLELQRALQLALAVDVRHAVA